MSTENSLHYSLEQSLRAKEYEAQENRLLLRLMKQEPAYINRVSSAIQIAGDYYLSEKIEKTVRRNVDMQMLKLVLRAGEKFNRNFSLHPVKALLAIEEDAMQNGGIPSNIKNSDIVHGSYYLGQIKNTLRKEFKKAYPTGVSLPNIVLKIFHNVLGILQLQAASIEELQDKRNGYRHNGSIPGYLIARDMPNIPFKKRL